MQRYFVSGDYKANEPLILTGDDFHHAIHVMRMSVGDKCYVAFHDQVTVIAEISEVREEDVLLIEVSQEESEKEMPYAVTVACGYTKGDKLEWVAQKATELGMSELIGFPAKTSVVKWDGKKLDKKKQRFEKIVKEAAEQSHRQKVPTIQLLTCFKELKEQLGNYDHVLVAYEESAKEGETKSFVKEIQSLKRGKKVLIIFGPEGGIAPSEIQELIATKGVLCGLGPRILRAETAPLYALSAMSYQWELLK